MKTCDLTHIITIDIPAIANIAFHPDGTLYGINRSGCLFTIDTLNGDTSFVHQFSGQLFQAMTCSKAGILFISGRDGELWTYDQGNDNATLLGNIGFQNNGDLAFFNGELYATEISLDYVIRVNLNNLAESEIVMTNAGGFGGGMYGIVTYARDCNDVKLYGIVSGNYTVVELDLETMTNDTICFLDRLYQGAATIEEAKASDPVRVIDTLISPADCGKANGMINISVQGGNPPYLFAIQGNSYQSENSFPNLLQGLYTILVKDSHGCMASVDVEVGENNVTLIDSLQVVQATCGMDNGSITLFSSSGDHLQYSIDSIHFQEDNYFTGLAAGHYRVIARNDSGCLEELEEDVNAIPQVQITNLQITPTTCGLSNGSLIVETQNVEYPLYAINGSAFFEDSIFENLQQGPVSLAVMDENGCKDDSLITIPFSDSLKVDSIIKTDPICGMHNGTIILNIANLNGVARYWLDDVEAYGVNSFSELDSGNHSWGVIDEKGCELVGIAYLNSGSLFQIKNIDVFPAECGMSNGTIKVYLSIPYSTIKTEVNNVLVEDSTVENLAADSYEFVFTDTNGCKVDTTVILYQNRCGVYIPNVFSPNDDGINDYFLLSSAPGQNLILNECYIYDRWGNLLYRLLETPVTGELFLWDGKFKDKPVNPGVYTYFIKIKYEDNVENSFKGSLTLIR